MEDDLQTRSSNLNSTERPKKVLILGLVALEGLSGSKQPSFVDNRANR